MDPDHQRSARDTVILLEQLWRKSGERLAVVMNHLNQHEATSQYLEIIQNASFIQGAR
jgi:hypothetical protein